MTAHFVRFRLECGPISLLSSPQHPWTQSQGFAEEIPRDYPPAGGGGGGD